MNESIKLDAVCDRCGLCLELVEGSEHHLIGCVACDVDAGEGATPADALENWYQNNPPVLRRPSPLMAVVPKQPSWLFEVDGIPFTSLVFAEEFARSQPWGHQTIYCKPRRQKAANQ